MSKLAAKIEATIRSQRLPYLSERLPPGEFILPYYDGLSIANTPATCAALLDVELPGAPPLPQDISDPCAGGVRCVLRILIDALGYLLLKRILADDPDHPFHRLLARGAQLVPLTSVSPSTTTTALTTLWTGRMPAEHGMMGTNLLLRSHSLRANMISFSPFDFNLPGVLTEFGLDAGKFIPVPGLAERLQPAGIQTHVFISQRYNQGGLSDIFFRGAQEIHPFVNRADLWVQLRDFMEAQSGQRLMVSVYLGSVDTISHLRGPSAPAVEADLNLLAYGLEREFINQLSPSAAKGVVMTILADHGQVDTPLSAAVQLDQHPELRNRLLIAPTGEGRFAYLHALQGQLEPIKAYCQEHLSHSCVVLDAKQALQAGLFGLHGGQLADETQVRIGDLIAIARGNHFMRTYPKPVPILGLHGGLNPEEMLVPYLCVRLD